ncbi:ECF RNA polymerase sigma factor SigK [Cumulibacter soli]|uniref:ECF RNA polymerase sigma factor SigK n=1 Tax=Cumulibacter soli TaxID=2546344 RepID=UPI001068CD65|nr:ECF RNA polymerase sigma factor SigK [Cumulibacter soli]
MIFEPRGERAAHDSAARPPVGEEELAQELLRRSSRGDEAAFAELYDLFGARIFGLIVRVVRDRAQSEEVTQEVFLQVWRNAARYRSQSGSATSWMLMMAHRRAVDRVRSAESSRRRDDEYAVGSVDRESDQTSETVERTMDGQRVVRALDTLTEVQRSAIELAYFGGYTHKEVAALLDLPLGTAKTRIRDGLIRLRDALGVAR